MTEFTAREAQAGAAEQIKVDRRIQRVSFDLYQRYAIAASVIRGLTERQSCSLLDVGGYSDQLWAGFGSLVSAFVPERKSFVVDVHREPGVTNYAAASGMNLPFADASFELVLAQDTLEHIPGAARSGFISELLRVARSYVLLSFPFANGLNEACDSLVYRFIRVRKNVELPALKEHLQFGLPVLNEVAGWISESGLPFRIWTHGNTLVWLNMMMAKNHLWAQGTPELGEELDAVFNSHFAAGDFREPCYRAFLLIAKDRQHRDAIHGFDGVRGEVMSVAAQEEVFSLCRLMMGSTASAEVERRSQHTINVLGELGNSLGAAIEGDRQALLDREIRLAEATSRAQHYENLLGEEQSRAKHYENLLQEEQRRRADIEHALEEQQRKREELAQELRSIKDKLSRFPARLFVRSGMK